MTESYLDTVRLCCCGRITRQKPVRGRGLILAPYFKGFTLEGAGLHQGRKQKGRETAHIMAARKQKDRIKITVFYLLPFTLPALLSYWLLLSHPGQGSSLSLVLSGTVLANIHRNMLSLYWHLSCHQAHRLNDLCLCPASRVLHGIYFKFSHIPDSCISWACGKMIHHYSINSESTTGLFLVNDKSTQVASHSWNWISKRWQSIIMLRYPCQPHARQMGEEGGRLNPEPKEGMHCVVYSTMNMREIKLSFIFF